MTKYSTQISAANLLDQLKKNNFITEEGLSDFIVNQQQEKKLPLYLRVLISTGALIAVIFFLGFLENSFSHIGFSTTLAIVLITSAVKLHQASKNKSLVKHTVLAQSSLALMIVGKISAVIAISINITVDNELTYPWMISLGLFIVTGITHRVYQVAIERFLFSFATLFSILVNILWNEETKGLREVLFNGFFLLQFAIVAILLTNSRINRDFIPITYALVFSLCVSVLFLSAHAEFRNWQEEGLIHPIFINFVLTGGLITLFAWAAGGKEKLKTEPLMIASLGAVLLGLISAPGILLTIGLMVIGYAKHEKRLITTGALLMPIFIWIYYYNLDISLLQKSGVLIGSGILLLAGRFYLRYQGWDERGTSCVPK